MSKRKTGEAGLLHRAYTQHVKLSYALCIRIILHTNLLIVEYLPLLLFGRFQVDGKMMESALFDKKNSDPVNSTIERLFAIFFVYMLLYA